jgi:hypothetical protein
MIIKERFSYIYDRQEKDIHKPVLWKTNHSDEIVPFGYRDGFCTGIALPMS